MKWKLTSQVNQSNHWQFEGADHSVELRYSKHARSFRLNTGEKRLFFMERTGFFQSKLLITSEYHVMVAECYFIKNRFAGILQLNNAKYEFRADGTQLSILKKDKTLLGHTIIENLESLDIFEFGALLFSFTSLLQQNNKNIVLQQNFSNNALRLPNL
jgi:hypothetical protein